MSYKNIGIIIQARTGSSRLPGKILLPIHKGSTSFLDVLLTRLTKEIPEIPVVVATTTNPDDDAIVKHAKAAKVPCFRGSERDVLDRFTSCAEEYNFETIIRICSDNPYLDIDLLKQLLDKYDGEDYLSYSVKNKPTILTHFGFFAEIVRTAALEKAKLLGDGCREHVTNCVYNNPIIFKIRFISIEMPNEKIRCTVDTKADFESMKQVYQGWYLKNKDTKCDHLELIKYLEGQPSLLTSMSNQILINSK